MPKKALDKNKLDDFKKRLFHLKEELLHDIKNLHSDNGEGAGENTIGHGMHMADAASDMYDREFSLNLASNDRELLQEIDTAIQRIEDGDYGSCRECGKEIPQARLKALPYVKNCLKCQEEFEQQGH